MNEKKDVTFDWPRLIRALLIGVAAGTLVCLLLLFIMAAIVASQDIPTVAVTPMAVIAASIGALVGGFFSARIARKNGLLVGVLCGLLLYGLILLAGTIFFQDADSSFWLIKLAIFAACGGVGGILGVNLRKR